MDIGVITMIQLFFAMVIGMYFWNLLKAQQGTKVAVKRESRKELDRLEELRTISLTEPLSEKTRPRHFSEIIGQKEGLTSLRAALCGPNPQHVIIYGPPGVGKTAAARLVLEEAKQNPYSPFRKEACFVEIDATTARFDERGIADPLIGSVHDPIYQGAGPMGMAGIPQPKPGAVTRAHGGVLFIDEIGELHSIQMNKLLKVLEDRKVILESAYYSAEDTNIPGHVKDIFERGLPADFRLVGATTRLPEDIPPAIRSRCVEIFFRSLLPDEVARIAANAVKSIGFTAEPGAIDVIGRYATNGRDAVNIVQIAAGIAHSGGGSGAGEITRKQVEWVVNSGQYPPRPERRVPPKPQVGVAGGLAVYGPNMGTLIELEAAVTKVGPGEGRITVTGAIDEEEFGGMGRPLKRRQSMARGSVENVITVLRTHLDANPRNYDIHVNFPGGMPIDGPSAGVALGVALYSAFKGVPVSNEVAMTGELSIRGLVRPVGGVVAKIEAAKAAGAAKVLIPRENWQETFGSLAGIEVVPLDSIEDALAYAVPAYGRAASEPAAEQASAAAEPRKEVLIPAAGGVGVPAHARSAGSGRGGSLPLAEGRKGSALEVMPP